MGSHSRIRRSLGQAVKALRDRAHRLDDCMRALGIVSVSKAQLWQRIRALQRSLPEERSNEPVR